ncbi:uncharacterized protein LOC135470353 isoform X2 [Liolophura sinensis]|uniref:uncharacterized protein LOC135470353 isoform X2 n=1 Tax=Liolophura sinensis TaxID=3198878 RepID=UPI00315976B2
MVLTTLVLPMRLRRDLHSPVHRTCRPRGRCRKMMRRESPTCLFAHNGGSHRHRGYSPLSPLVEDLLGIWKDVAGFPLCKSQTTLKPDWKETLNCEGFSPDEVELEISKGKVCVSCCHEENDGRGNVDIRQLKKTINVPEDVDCEKLRASFNRRAILVITAPRKPDGEEKKADAAAKSVEHMDLDWQREEEESSCRDCVEEDKGDTSDSSGEDMDIQKVDSIDLTQDEVAEQNPEADVCVQPESKPLDNDVQIVEDKFEAEVTEQSENETLEKDVQMVGEKFEEEVSLHPENKTFDKDVQMIEKKLEEEALKQPDDISQNIASQPEMVCNADNHNKEEPALQKETAAVEPENRLFEIHVDMKNFNPDSIEVKLNGNTLTISGKQEDKDEATGKVVSSRAVYRRFVIPDYVNCDLLTSSLDSQGLMIISAPYKSAEDLAEKVIPISVQ